MIDNAAIEKKLAELRALVKEKHAKAQQLKQEEHQITVDIIGITGAIAEFDQMLHPREVTVKETQKIDDNSAEK